MKINKFEKSRIEDSYDLEHIIQKAVELVSRKTIIWALKQILAVISRKIRVDPNLRALVIFSKEKII